MATFGLFETEQAARDERVMIDPPATDEPGFFKGMGKAVGMGVMRGGAKAAQAVGIAAAAPLVAVDRFTGGRSADSVFSLATELVEPAIEYWTPAPADVGTAGKIIGAFSEAVLPLMAGGGNPAPLMGTMGLSEGAGLVKDGATPGGAAAVATISAGTLGVGFKVPFLGQTLAQRIAFGAGSNAALGVAQRGASKAVLDATGSPGLGLRYEPFDAEALAVDTLLGAAFGGIAHAADTGLRDAALTANAAKRLEVDSAPGKPLTDTARTAHVQAMEKATAQVLRGEPVSVAEAAGDLRFEPSPVKQSAMQRFRAMVDKVAREYGSRSERMPGDEWFPPTQQPGTTIAVSEEVRTALARALAGEQLAPADRRAIGAAMDAAQSAIREGDTATAARMADELEAYLREPEVRDEFEPSEADTRLIAQASRIDADAVERAAIQAGDDDAAFMAAVRRVIDDEVRATAVRSAPQDRAGVAAPDDRGTTQAGPAQGVEPGQAGGRFARITPRPDGSFEVVAANSPMQSATLRRMPDGSMSLERQPKARGGAEDLELQAAEQVIARSPDMEVIGPNGEVMTARELMRKADEGIRQAQEDARAIEAAVQCFLRS